MEWVDRWNYWIWLAAWLPWIVVLLRIAPARGIRFLVSGGLLSLLRAVCLFLFPLGPVRGADVNLAHAWD